MSTPDDSIASGIALLLRTFAKRPRNWLVLARNLIPVVGVYELGWSSGVTLLNYWVDGVCLLALLLIAIFVRGGAEQRREKPDNSLVGLVVALLIGFLLFFGLLGIPYWMVYGVLDLGVPLYQVSESRQLTTGLLSVVVASVVGAFQRGGYFTMPLDQLKHRAQPEIELLATRGLAMMMIAYWTLGVLMVPLYALALTAFEVWPAMKVDLGLVDSGVRR